MGKILLAVAGIMAATTLHFAPWSLIASIVALGYGLVCVAALVCIVPFLTPDHEDMLYEAEVRRKNKGL